MKKKRQDSQRAIKRAFDLVASLLALIVLSPLMAFIALTIRLLMGSPVLSSVEGPVLSSVEGPVLFLQQRPGLH